MKLLGDIYNIIKGYFIVILLDGELIFWNGWINYEDVFMYKILFFNLYYKKKEFFCNYKSYEFMKFLNYFVKWYKWSWFYVLGLFFELLRFLDDREVFGY